MKVVLFSLLGLVALIGLAALVFQIAGSRLPREHRASVTVTLAASREAVWAAIMNYAAMPQWWPAVKSVRFEKLPDGTELTWNKDSHGKEIAFRTGESRVNERLVRVIVGNDLPFGGTWTFDLADAGNGTTRLTITEDGFINPPIFRAVAQWFLGLDATMRDCVTHLEKHLAKK
jgi:uncharacterized protein YndB with AHSA1/START domain